MSMNLLAVEVNGGRGEWGQRWVCCVIEMWCVSAVVVACTEPFLDEILIATRHLL